MDERYSAATETEATPDTDTNRQIAALYDRLAESLVAVLTLNRYSKGSREARPIGFA